MPQIRQFTLKEFFEMSITEFEVFYESKECRQVRDYLETRVRLELIEIIRRFKLNGQVQFEVRQKTYNSAYKKVKKEVLLLQHKNTHKKYYLFEIIKDVVGARIICMDEEIQKRVFEYILQIESLVIQPDGLEFYSAPFREFTATKDAHNSLEEIVNRISKSSKKQQLKKKTKESNYESLHFYVKFGSRYDNELRAELTKPKIKNNRVQRIRDVAERNYLEELHKSASPIDRAVTQKVPIEFQIRTITEHLWAHEEHSYLYKPSSPADLEEADNRLSVLKSAFVGLKYAYYNVDRLRAMVRNVSPAPKVVIHRGTSKDFNSIRFRFFKAENPDIIQDFLEADGLYEKSNRRFSIVGSNENLLELILGLYKNSIETHAPQIEGFDPKDWGKRRLFYLFLAYILMFTNTKKLPANMAKRLKNETGLEDLIGYSVNSFDLADNMSMLKLATVIYERIVKYDGFARAVRIEGDKNEYFSEVFRDPLVGIRFASSFFLQGDFAGAAKALNGVFELGAEQDFSSWNELKLGKDFSLSQILMRYSQNVIFHCDNYNQELVDSFDELKKVFFALFEIDSTSYCPHLYRAYCWYYSIVNYFFTQSTLVSEDLVDFKDHCRSYILEHHKTARENSVFESIEVQLALVYLPIHYRTNEISSSQLKKSYRDFGKKLESFDAYPQKAKKWIFDISENLHSRAAERLSSPPYSTFISYARNDCKDLAIRAAKAFEQKGLTVRYDQYLKRGQDLYFSIQKDISAVTSALVLITESHFESKWAKEELALLMERRRREEIDVELVLIGVSREQLYENYPFLINILYHETTRHDFDGVIYEIISEIQNSILNNDT